MAVHGPRSCSMSHLYASVQFCGCGNMGNVFGLIIPSSCQALPMFAQGFLNAPGPLLEKTMAVRALHLQRGWVKDPSSLTNKHACGFQDLMLLLNYQNPWTLGTKHGESGMCWKEVLACKSSENSSPSCQSLKHIESSWMKWVATTPSIHQLSGILMHCRELILLDRPATQTNKQKHKPFNGDLEVLMTHGCWSSSTEIPEFGVKLGASCHHLNEGSSSRWHLTGKTMEHSF